MLNRCCLTALGGVLLALAAGPALAQSSDAVEVGEVVITAARSEAPRATLPATVTVIGSEEMVAQQALGASAVETVASLVPSFSPTRQKLSGLGESLRGRSPLYLVDGVPQSTPLRDDSRDGFTIDPFFIDRVEVVFGSSAIQGIGATGGVVNYVTAATPKAEDGWSGRAMAQTTFDDGVVGDSLGWKAAALAGRDMGDWDFVVGAAYERRGAFYDAKERRIGVDGTQGDLQDSTSWSLFLKAGWDITEARRLELMANHFELEGDADYVAVAGDRSRGVPTTSIRGTTPGVPPKNQVTSAALSYRDGDLLGGTFRAQLYAHDYEGVFGGGTFASFQDPSIAPLGTLFDQSANNSEKQGFKLDYERPIGAVPGLRALLGLDGLRDTTFQALVLTPRLWVPKTTYKSLAPFVQLRQSLLDGRLHLSAGARHENATLEVGDYRTLWGQGDQQVDGGEPSFEKLLVNFGTTFEAADGLIAYAAYNQGFTMPDVGRVLRAVNTPGADIDTYLDVTPVISDNVELGLELERGPLRASAAWFRSTSDRGALLIRNADGNFDVQRQRTEIEGVELTARWTANDWLTVGGAYAHLEGRTDEDGDGSVDRDLAGINIAPDRLLLYVEAAFGDFSGRLQHQTFFERSFDGEPATNSFEGYAIADAVLAWRTEPATFTLGVQNLFDEDYVTYYSDTQAPADNLAYYFGRGRTLTLGVSKAF